MAKKRKNFSIDVRDIYYFIDHVKDIDFRVSLIKELGYDIGVDVADKDCFEKRIIVGKRNELRVQITPKERHLPFVKCAILK
jgi:hypothetical protein